MFSKSSPNKEDGKKQQQEQQTQEISPLLPKFKEYAKSDIVFKKFVPKKIFFIALMLKFLSQLRQWLLKKYTEIFGIKNASDIQRFCYYPGTKNIYTFIGFDSESKLEKATKAVSFRAMSINKDIYIYPFIINSEENDRSQQKVIQKNISNKKQASSESLNYDYDYDTDGKDDDDDVVEEEKNEENNNNNNIDSDDDIENDIDDDYDDNIEDKNNYSKDDDNGQNEDRDDDDENEDGNNDSKEEEDDINDADIIDDFFDDED